MKKPVDRFQVECYSGHRFAEEPRGFTWHGVRYVVEELQETWRSPRGLHFIVRTADCQRFELTYDEITDVWNVNPVARKD
jgi:hypothetical protein